MITENYSFFKRIILNFFQLILIFAPLVFILTNALKSQPISTEPQLKNFLIERGTGIACGSCPTKELENLAIIANYPEGRGYLIQYHFGPDARPQAGKLNVDYRTRFGDSIMTPVWPFYLNMMVNRRDKGNGNSTFIIGSEDQVTPECASVASQFSCVNLSMSSTYDPLTREITVNAKAYYTANSATPENYLQIIITEDSIIGPQVGVNGSSKFIYDFAHMNMFRANINGNMGDLITTTTAGTTIEKIYKYVVPHKYGTGPEAGWVIPNPDHFKLNMFMTEAPNASGTQSFTGKIITIIREPLGVTTQAEEKNDSETLNVFPNPADDRFIVKLNTKDAVNLQVHDLLGILKIDMKMENGSAEINASSLPSGIYQISATSRTGAFTTKLIKR